MNISESADGSRVPKPPDQLMVPDHELLRRIGKGSYGEIWLARNIMGTFRAIKVIHRASFDSESPFDREIAGIKRFEPISRTHDGFVDVLQIGSNEKEGYFYYVMEIADDCVRGQEIDADSYVPKTLGKALARRGRFSVDECVQTGMALCQALEHLHQRGLVHRDIKPSNIVFINGSPKLADIGLVTDSQHAQTFVGTEGFIPPEGPGSKQADIYSLGKALYEIASGRDRLDFPALPAGFADFEDRDAFLELNEALIRACRQNPRDRYGSAREMYEDLALLVSKKSLRRLRALERRWASVKRNAIIGAGAMVVAGLIGFPIVQRWKHANEIQERKIGSHSAIGIRKLEEGDHIGALAEFAEIFELEKSNPAKYLVNQTRVSAILANSPRLNGMFFLKGRVGSISFSADGRSLLAAAKNQLKDGFVEVSPLLANGDTSFKKTIHRLGAADFSSDNSHVVAISEGGSGFIWNLKTGGEKTFEIPAGASSIKFSPDGELVAIGCKNGNTEIWHVGRNERVKELKGHVGAVRTVGFSPDGALVATGGIDGTARLYNLESGRQIHPPFQHSTWVTDLHFSPRGDRLVTACHDSWAHLWSVESGQEIPTLMKHDANVIAAQFSPDGSMILTASTDGTAKLWDGRTTMPLPRNRTFRHTSSVFSACFSRDGRRIATGCVDGTVRVWDLSTSATTAQLIEGAANRNGSHLATIKHQTVTIRDVRNPGADVVEFDFSGSIRSLAVSEDGKALAAWTVTPEDPAGSVNFWNGKQRHPAFVVPLSTPNRTLQVRFSDSGELMAFKDNNFLRIVETKTAAEWPVPGEYRNGGEVAFHPLDKLLAIGAGSKVRVFDRKGTPVGPEQPVEGTVRQLVFSHEGSAVLVSQSDDTINPKPAELLKLSGSEITVTKMWHKDGVNEATFTFDDERLATASESHEVTIWDTTLGTRAIPILNLNHQALAVAFNETGRLIGTTSGDRSVQIWDAETGLPLTPPLFRSANQTEFRFLKNGKDFLTSDGSQRAWLDSLPQTDISPADAIALGRLLNSELHGGPLPGNAHISKSWQQLKEKAPRFFSVANTEIEAWHIAQKTKAEARSDTRAVQFHRQLLGENKAAKVELAEKKH